MAEAGALLARVLKTLGERVLPGIKTQELETLARKLIEETGAKPAFLGYRPERSDNPYPHVLCVSVNDVIVHGQPSHYIIKDGDVVKLDLGLRHKGFCVDSAVTLGAGAISPATKKLIRVTAESLNRALAVARVGNTLGDIGHAIQSHVEKNNFEVVRSLTGHGIGKDLHEDPPVFNFGKKGAGIELEEGMALAIEPMVGAGSGTLKNLGDRGFATADGSLSAHIEHTVAITANGPRVLTQG